MSEATQRLVEGLFETEPLGLQMLSEPYRHEGLQLGAQGAVLVRPDGHVAWRMPWTPKDPAAELESVLATLLD